MPTDYLAKHQSELDHAIQFLRDDIVGLRTGRANPSIVENVMVEAYETHMQLTAVASVSTPDARTIQIEPWDKSVVKAVEKAIIDSKLGLMPNTAGTVIRIVMPPLTEENRRNLVKVLGDKLENARKTVRAVRDEVRAEIIAAEREKEMGEDEKYRALETLDKVCASFNDRIKAIGDEKEKDIMTV